MEDLNALVAVGKRLPSDSPLRLELGGDLFFAFTDEAAYILALFDRSGQRQGWHDRAAGTIVTWRDPPWNRQAPG